MIKNYILIFSLLFTSSIFAQEVLTFAGYDGVGTTITATSATVNDEITIVFEDVDIINNFYTDGRTYIHMFGGLDTPSGTFQGSPGFSDLASQPQLTLIASDTDSNVGPNTYSITINLKEQYSSVPEGTTVYGFNLLFQNEFGGGGNNQSSDLYIDLIDNVTLSTIENNLEQVSLNMIGNELNIKNFSGKAKINAFDLSGKQILNIDNISVSNNYTKTISLPKNQISFIVFEAEGIREVLKVITK